jgi:hypothetical protein
MQTLTWGLTFFFAFFEEVASSSWCLRDVLVAPGMMCNGVKLQLFVLYHQMLFPL